MIVPEREFLQAWDETMYPRGPEMPEPVQVAQAPVEGAGGAAFGVFPAMRSAASRTGEISAAGRMLPADVAAGAVKGAVTGGVGMAGDIESLIRGVRGIFTRGGDQGKLDAFLAGLEEKTILPTSEDVSKWLDTNVGPVVPEGAPMAKQRAGVAQAGQFAGEIVSGPGALIKGGKAAAKTAVKTAKFIKPKVGEMLSDYMSRSGMTPELMAYHGTPHRFERFDASKIGTGEGMQAYGHGLYFAESPDVANVYAVDVSAAKRKIIDRSGLFVDGKQIDPGDPTSLIYGEIADKGAQQVIDSRTADLQKLIAEKGKDYPLVKIKQKSLDQIRSIVNKGEKVERITDVSVSQPIPTLYTVDIPDEMVGKMLDWDKPLVEQPENVRNALKRRITDVRPTDGFDMGGNAKLRDNRKGQIDKTSSSPWLLEAPSGNGMARFGLTQKDVDRMFGAKDVSEITGHQILSRLTEQMGSQAKASEYLRSLGIPGIRYLDRSSRAGGEGTRNIVVFPGGEDQVKIIKVE